MAHFDSLLPPTFDVILSLRETLAGYQFPRMHVACIFCFIIFWAELAFLVHNDWIHSQERCSNYVHCNQAIWYLAPCYSLSTRHWPLVLWETSDAQPSPHVRKAGNLRRFTPLNVHQAHMLIYNFTVSCHQLSYVCVSFLPKRRALFL